MKFDYSTLLVCDIEATCEKDGKPFGGNEIIEVGVCEYEVATGNLLRNEGIFVKPDSIFLSSFCKELTGIAQADVTYAAPLSEAVKKLIYAYNSKHRVWASWGAYDMIQFREECVRKDIPYPFSEDHINLKSLFSLKYKLPKGLGMVSALEMVRLPLEGKHHRGVDDSRNIATLARKVFE